MELPQGFSNTRFVFSLAGAPSECGFSIATENNGVDDAEAVALKMSGSYQESFILSAASILVGWTYLGTRTTHNSLAGEILGDAPASIVGTGVGAGLIVNSAFLVKKVTNQGGRKHRGRLFIPPFNMAETGISPTGVWTPSVVTDAATGWSDFYDKLIVDDLVPVLLHTDPADAPTVITGFTPMALAATQRRRMR